MIYSLITGATSGIGYELARLMADKGHNLILVGRNMQKLLDVKNKLGNLVDVQLIECDLAQQYAAQKVYDAVQKVDDAQIEILINNAGFGHLGSFAITDPAKLHEMMSLNMLTLTELTRLFVPNMITRRSGKIMNVASTAAFMPGPQMAVYFATKAYVLSLSQALSHELSCAGITVTTLCPGPTSTSFASNAAAQNSGYFKNSNALPSASDVAHFGYKSMMRGKRVAVHGILNRLITIFSGFIPSSISAKLVEMTIT